MAIVIGSTFKPFDYATMNNPVAQATQEHKLLEDAYGELATKASIWEGMANQQADPKAYQTYLQYANDLHDQANVLAKQGLNPMAKRALNDMKSRYAQEITPIEQAYQKREANTAEQRKAKLQNPTIIFDRDFSTTSLDELIENPSLSYTNINGDVITKQVAEAASNLAKQVRTDPRRWHDILGQQYYETTMKRGLSDNEILATISQTEGGRRELQKIMDDVISTSGVTSWNSPEALEQVRQYANQGAWAAIGQTNWETLANKAFGATPPSGPTLAPSESLNTLTVPLTSEATRTPYNVDKDVYEDIRVATDSKGNIISLSNKKLDELDKDTQKARERLLKLNDSTKDYDPSSPWAIASGPWLNTANENKAFEENRIAENTQKSQEIRGKLQDAVRRFSPLSNNLSEAIQKGMDLEQIQSREQKEGIPVITSRDGKDDSVFKNTLMKIANSLNEDDESLLEELDKNLNPTNKAIKVSKAKKILGDKEAQVLSVPGLGFVVSKGGDKYLVGGAYELIDYNKRAQGLNNFLKGFTSGTITEVPNIEQFEDNPERLYEYARAKGVSIEGDMYGVMVKDGNDLRRIVLRPRKDEGYEVYQSSLQDELTGSNNKKARMRRNSLERLAKSELSYFMTLTEGTRRPSTTLPQSIGNYQIED